MIKKTVNEQRKHVYVDEIESVAQPKLFVRILIFIITTIFAPLTNQSLRCLIGQIEIGGGQNFFYFVSATSLFLLLLVNPIIFLYGIKYTRPEKFDFDNNGTNEIDQREIYYLMLKKHNNAFNEIYKEYTYKGSYYKIIIMYFKFIHMALLVIEPSPEKNGSLFALLYIFDIIFNGALLYYTYYIKPYHDYRSNICACLNFANQIVVLILNMILLGSDTSKDNPNFSARMSISILQLLSCAFIFFSYYLKTLSQGIKYINGIFKILFKRLLFTSFQLRGLSNCYERTMYKSKNFIYFNSNIYNRDKEIKIILWDQFWKSLIQEDSIFKLNSGIENLVFTYTINASPSLVNFKGTVEERVEENSRILQRIGRQQYENELLNNQRQEYLDLKEEVFDNIPPIDAYYNGFCKVSFFPFPFSCLLQYEYSNEIQLIQGEQNLRKLVNVMQSEDYLKARKLRTIVRLLNQKEVIYEYSEKTTKTWNEYDDEGNYTGSKTLDATIYYKNAKFISYNICNSQYKLNGKSSIDLGKDLRWYLYYSNSKGIDKEGTEFEGGSISLNFEINFFNGSTGVISKILENNQIINQNNIQEIYDQLFQYNKTKREDMKFKQQILSYDFNIRILNAPINVFSDRNTVNQILQKENNIQLKNLMIKFENKFNLLFERIQQFRNDEFSAYIYFVFKDIWSQNQDLSIIKKNKVLLDPDCKDTCLIYQKNLNIQDWVNILTVQGLRDKKGKGYLSDKLLRKFLRMIDKFQDKPETFYQQSDLLSFQQEVSKEEVNNEKKVCNFDIENQREQNGQKNIPTNIIKNPESENNQLQINQQSQQNQSLNKEQEVNQDENPQQKRQQLKRKLSPIKSKVINITQHSQSKSLTDDKLKNKNTQSDKNENENLKPASNQ